MIKKLFLSITVGLVLFFSVLAEAKTVVYDLTIADSMVNFTGKPAMAMTVNGGIPGPTLIFTEGDTAVVHVHNQMKMATSIHWHGVLLPNDQDGVPFLTTPEILAGQTFTYKFPIKQSGTYWYHSHTMMQEQQGVLGAIVIKPKNNHYSYARDEVVILSDWTNENPGEVLRTLKSGSDYYSYKKHRVPSLFGAIREKSFGAYLGGAMRMMPPMDVADVGYDAFLINGKNHEEHLNAKAGEWIRLRIVNASSSTYFYLNDAHGPIKVISADGVDVVPFEQDRMLVAIAETYDVLVQVPTHGSYELRATAQDGSGSVSYWIGQGKKVSAANIPNPSLYKMSMDMSAMLPGNSMMNMKHMDMSGSDERPDVPYQKIKALKSTKLDSKRPKREVVLNLTGDMNRYLWSFNNKTMNESDDIVIKKGEAVRFVLVNKTMMHHPIHLHGHFFRVINQYGDFSPLKHTVDISPMSQVTIEFAADEEKDWAFHCHVLYHMMSGMMRVVHYEDTVAAPEIASQREKLHENPVYLWGSLSGLSQMSEGKLQLSNERNDLKLEWQNNWHGNFEVDGTYSRYFSRFFSVFGGVEKALPNTVGIAGVDVLLPFLVKAQARVDSQGDFRFSLARELTLLPHFVTFGRVRFDTDEKWEWAAGAKYLLSRNFALVGQYHSDYGAGGGLEFRF